MHLTKIHVIHVLGDLEWAEWLLPGILDMLYATRKKSSISWFETKFTSSLCVFLPNLQLELALDRLARLG